MSDNDLFRVQEVAKKSLKLKGQKRREWVETSFIEPEIDDMYAKKYGATDGYLGSILTSKRLGIFLTLAFILLSSIIGRATQLQIVQGAEYRDKSDQNRLRIEHLRADRGLIYDRYKKPLVINTPNYVATVVASLLPTDQEERKEILTTIYQQYVSEYRDDSIEEFLEEVDKRYRSASLRGKPFPIAEFMKQDDAINLQILTQNIPSFQVELFSRRQYLNEGPPDTDPNDLTVYPPVKSLSHLLGYQTSLHEGEYEELATAGYLYNDVIGRSGLEYTYEKVLRGVFGQKQYEVTAQGIEQKVIGQSAPIDGQSLLSTIDLELQREAERVLQRYLDENEKTKGSVVILEPNTGQVLAMVSLPTYDNNQFAKRINPDQYAQLITNEDRPLFLRSISGEYPSGSTFKPIVAAAALEEQVVTEHTAFLSTGGIRISLWFFPDWRAGGHGQTNVYHALADSVNTYFYIIGGGTETFEGLGVQRISAYARQFGLSEPLTIDLPGEVSGFLPSKEWKEETKGERWYIGDTYHLAIGQGDLLVTPLQVASFFATFANGGTVYQPHLVSAYLDQQGRITKSIQPKVLEQVDISAEHIETVQTGLRRVVTVGSGKRLGALSVPVSGKTGTAQWHSSKPPHAWFAGYAPSTNPEIAFSVLVEEGEEGSGITVAITNEILQWWIENRYQAPE